MLSDEIQSLYESVKAKFSDIPQTVHDFFLLSADKAKAEEAAAQAADQAIRDKVQAEIDHLTALGYSVIKAGYSANEATPQAATGA